MTRARRNEQRELEVQKGQYDEPLIGHRRVHHTARRPKLQPPQDLGKLLYIATLINPVDHRFYTVIWDNGQLEIITPTDQNEIEIWGTGILAEDDFPAQETQCPRTHTPGGVVIRGKGLGLMLYSGLALAAAMGSQMKNREAKKYDLPNMEPCVSSSEKGPGRSTAADEWWSKQVKLGFAKKFGVSGGCEDDEIEASIGAEDAGYDEDRILGQLDREGDVENISGELSGRIEFTFCPRDIDAQVVEAEQVFRKGLVFHWNERLQPFTEDAPKLSGDVLLEVDLDGVEEPHLIEMFLAELHYVGVSDADIRTFLRRNGLADQPRLPGVELGAPRPYAKFQKNASKPKHSQAWRKMFGELVTDTAAVAVENRRKKFPEFSAKDAKTIGTSIGINWRKVDLDEFRRGLSVELEHGGHDPETDVTGDDLITTGKIAWAHLKEVPDYYTRLAEVEGAREEKYE